MPERNPDVQGNSESSRSRPHRRPRDVSKPSAVELGCARTMRWLRASLFAPVLGFGLSACAESRVSLATGPREYVPSDYAQVLDTWTRDKTLVELSDLDGKLTEIAKRRGLTITSETFHDAPAAPCAPHLQTLFADAIESLLYRPKLRTVARSAAEALPWDKTIQLMMLLHGIEGIGSKAPSVITKRKLMIAS